MSRAKHVSNYKGKYNQRNRNKIFSSRIHDIKKSKPLTYDNISNESGIPSSTLCKLVHGYYEVKPYHLRMIENVYSKHVLDDTKKTKNNSRPYINSAKNKKFNLYLDLLNNVYTLEDISTLADIPHSTLTKTKYGYYEANSENTNKLINFITNQLNISNVTSNLVNYIIKS